MPLPKSRSKLITLFKNIKDEKLRIIISEVVGIENDHRSSNKFPIKKIENAVDNVANLIELESNEERGE